MNPKREEVIDIAKKFKWIDSTKMRIINSEGIEKIVDV
jgi:hypothetical protein